MHRAVLRSRGMALLVVMVLVLLAALLIAGALRTAWLNELVAGNEVDYQRSFERAQALLGDAELDIRGLCATQGAARNCRPRGKATESRHPWFPRRNPEEFEALRFLLSGSKPACQQGICLPEGVAPEFWRMPAGELERMKAVAAHYGEFSGAASPAASDPLLMARGWYWVEVLPMDPATLTQGDDSPFAYRITAIAEGRRPATRAVLQSVLVWRKEPPP